MCVFIVNIPSGLVPRGIPYRCRSLDIKRGERERERVLLKISPRIETSRLKSFRERPRYERTFLNRFLNLYFSARRFPIKINTSHLKPPPPPQRVVLGIGLRIARLFFRPGRFKLFHGRGSQDVKRNL